MSRFFGAKYFYPPFFGPLEGSSGGAPPAQSFASDFELLKQIASKVSASTGLVRVDLLREPRPVRRPAEGESWAVVIPSSWKETPDCSTKRRVRRVDYVIRLHVVSDDVQIGMMQLDRLCNEVTNHLDEASLGPSSISGRSKVRGGRIDPSNDPRLFSATLEGQAHYIVEGTSARLTSS